MKYTRFFSIKSNRKAWSYSNLILFVAVLTLCQKKIAAQVRQDSFPLVTSIFQLMERNDLPLDEIERIAENYFTEMGTGRGSGFKQYQRWLYERKFHVDENGYFIDPDLESRNYNNFLDRQPSTSRSTDPWSELGPDDWSNTSGWNPGIGRITSIAIHPSNESIIYVSSPGGGIWKSTNGGTTWVPLLDDIDAAWMYIYNIRIDPSNQNTIYAAVMQGGVIKSTNAGTAWTATGSGPVNTRKVVVHPSNSNIILCTAANGIWRSTNAGDTWTQVHAANSEDIEFKPDNADIIYVSGNSNTIKRSTNNGITWAEIGAAGGITHTGRTLLGVTPDNPNIVYAVQANINVFGRMYKSSDAGLNFITTVVGNPAIGTNYFGYDPMGMDTIGQAGYDMAICVNPVNEDEVHIAGIICWKSINGGFDFTAETVWSYPNSTGYNHADVHALEWVNTTIYSGSDGGIYKSSNNGDDWTDLSIGLGIRQVYRVACAKTNSQVITIGSQDNGSSYRQTSGEWIEWLGADGMDNMISPVNASIAYGTWQLGVLNKTLDSGQTRIYLGSPSAGNWITPLDMHPTNHDEIYGGWTGVYKSTDGGSNWTNISTGYINKKLNTLVVAESDVDYIYASANNKLYRTTNGGMTWDSLSMTNDVTSIFISNTNPEKIWVTLNATSNQVLFSTNMGTNFTSISSGLPALSARTVVVDEDDADGVYVGMNIGVYYRNNDEPAWIPFGTELPLVAINELEIHETSGKIRVATYGRGIWENDLSSNTGGGCTEYAYVPNGQSNTVSVVELPSNTLVTTINVGTNPLGVCHKSTGDKVFITNTQSDNISVINTTTNEVIATIALPSNASPVGIGITPDDARVFVANSENGTVSVINTSTHAIIQTINVGGVPNDIQVTPDGNKAFVSDNELFRVRIINTSNYSIESTVNIPYGATHIRFTPDGSLAFVMNPYEKVYALSTATNTIIDSVAFPYGYYSTALCVSTDGAKLYAGYYDDSPGPTLGIVDISSFTIETYATGFCCGVGGLSTNGNGSLLYVTNPSYNKVSVINTSTYAAVGTFNVGLLPFAFGDFVVNCSDSTGGPSVCGTIFTDSGGVNGNYSNNENKIDTLCPNSPADKIELSFTVFALESGYDYLKIFDGNSINSPPLHSGNGFTGTILPGTFVSTHATGCLTTQFTSDNSVTDTGWVANVACIPMGSNPPCDEFAYVPNSDLHNVSVVNLQTQAIVTTIAVNNFPHDGCHSNDGDFMYISNIDSDFGASIFVIETASNSVIDSINIPGPHYSTTGICISPDDSKLYVTTSSFPPGTAKLYIIDATTNTIITSVDVGGTILSMQVTPDGSKLYAANNRRDSVWVFNTATNSIITKIPVVDWTFGLAISPDGSKVYVSTFDETIEVISTVTNSVTGSIGLPGRAYGLCVSPDGQKLYAANYFIDSVSVINTATNSIIKNILVGAGPKAINSNGDGTKMYVFNQDSEDISIIQTSNDSLLLTFDGGGNVGGLGDFVVNCADTTETSVCGSLFYDSGGAAGTYSINEDIVTMLCPGNTNQSVLVEFLDFNVESNWDALYVFNGNSFNAPPIPSGNPVTNSGFPAGGYYGSNIPGPFQSTDTSGCLTFRFLSDNSINLDGWEATIDCIARPVNDLCANAILIECSDLVSGTNVNASFDTDTFCVTYPGTSGVWYKLIGTGDTITLTTCHPSSDFDTQIHVYTGTCSDFECVTGNDDDPLCGQSTLFSTVEFLSMPGEEYYILISGFQSSTGQFTLQVPCGSTPSDNNCLHFDGINDNVYGPSNSLFELVDGTIEVWVKPENKATSQTFISYRNDSGSSTRYLFNFLGNLSGLGFWNGTSYATFAYAFTANQWYHLAFVDDGVNTKIYINGVYAGSFNLQFSSASGSGLHLVLGYDIPLSEYYNGALDEIRIWSSPLPESVLFENMSCGIPVTGDCLVAYYKFNQGIPSGANGSITTLLDQSNNNLNATLQNFTLSGTTSNWIEATNGVTDTCENPSFQNIVTSSLDGVYGSLRTTIACAESGSTITFSPDLPSDTLTILTPIPINKIITVNGVAIPGLLLDASTSTYAFDILSNGIVDLFSLQVKCGTHPQHSGLRNNGITGLHDILFETNMNSPILSNYNSLTIHGLTSLLR